MRRKIVLFIIIAICFLFAVNRTRRLHSEYGLHILSRRSGVRT